MVILETKATYHVDKYDEVFKVPEHSNVVIHSNRIDRNRLAACAQYRKDKDITLYVENVRPNRDNTRPPEQLFLVGIAKLIEGFEDVFICYDLAHAQLSKEDLSEFVKYSHLIRHIHLTDTIPPHDRHLPLYEGTLPVDEFMRLVGEVDFMGNIKIERWPGIPDTWGMRS